MGPRSQAGVFWAINLVLITVVAFLIADITAILISQRLEVPVLQTVPPLPKNEDLGALPRPRIVSASILQSGVFRRPIEMPGLPDKIGQIGQNRRFPVEPLKVRLIGTVVGEPTRSFAVLGDLVTNEQTLYRLNDRVLGAAKIVAIERNKIKIKRGEYLETLEVALDDTTFPKPVPQTAVAEPGDPRRLVLDRREVNAGFENLASLMTKARVYPHLSDGKTDGFMIRDIVPGSLYERIGLRNNDILRRINGIEVRDPETLFKLLLGLKDETAISLDLIRSARPETYAYEIR